MSDGAPAPSDRRPDFRLAVRALVAERRRRLGRHPTAETLADYHLRRLPDGTAARLREHLAICPECGDRVLALAATDPSQSG